MNGNCGVCGLKASFVCPEHGERCDAHVPTHVYCPQLRPMCVSCGAPVPEGGEGVPKLCGACCETYEDPGTLEMRVTRAQARQEERRLSRYDRHD